MARHENTKERFLFEALKLFSERGFEAVTLSEIAREVGCVPSALYRHYRNKQKLYEAILEESRKGYEAGMQQAHVDFSDHPELREEYIAMTEQDQIAQQLALFSYVLNNEWAAAFRKLMMLEQFHMPELAEMYNNRYVYAQYDQYAELFRVLIAAGKLRDEDPYMMAVAYISPLSVLIGVCDRDPSRVEWARQILTDHVRAFNRAYRL